MICRFFNFNSNLMPLSLSLTLLKAAVVWVRSPPVSGVGVQPRSPAVPPGPPGESGQSCGRRELELADLLYRSREPFNELIVAWIFISCRKRHTSCFCISICKVYMQILHSIVDLSGVQATLPLQDIRTFFFPYPCIWKISQNCTVG